MFPEEEILQQLEAPVKSFRLFALEETIQKGSSERILQCLEKLKPDETDEECLLLISHAIESVKKRLNRESAPPPEITDWKSFLDQWKSGAPQSRLALLKSLRGKLVSELAFYGPELLEKESHPTVAAAIIKTFARTWPRDKFAAISSRLLSKSLSIRLSCLEVLIKVAPAQLKAALPRLLISDDPRTRALSIAGLAQIDLQEALLHLDSLLQSQDLHQKKAGLQNAFILPVEEIKPVLLKFLAAETDPDLLTKAGLLFLSNPDLETPYRLWEISESSPHAKALVIKKLVTDLCRVIREAGLIEGDFSRFLEQLQAWIRNREARRYVQSCVHAFSGNEGSTDPEHEQQLRSNIHRPEVKAAFQEALEWPIPPGVLEKIKTLLGTLTTPEKPAQGSSEKAPDGDTPGKAESPGKHESPSHEETVRKVAAWKAEDLEKGRTELSLYLSDPKTPPDLRATSFRAAARLKVEGYLEAAEKCLPSGDGNLVSAAMEYMAAFDADGFFLHVGRLLQRANQRIKSTALRILGNYDTREALSRISAMLKSPSKDQQLGALSCMVVFDFSLVRDSLTIFLADHATPEFVSAGLCLFASNPDLENLYPLFSLEKTLTGEPSEAVKKVRRETERVLETQGLLTPAKKKDLEKSFPERYQQENEKKKAPPSPYSVKALQGTRQESGESAPFYQLIWQNHTFRLTFIGLFALVGIGYLLSGPVVSRPEYLPKERVTITGKLLSKGIEPGELILRAGDGAKFLVEVEPKKAEMFHEGDGITAVLIPYRPLPDGVTTARLEKIEKSMTPK